MIIGMLMMLSMNSMERRFWEKECLWSMPEELDVTGPVTGTEEETEEEIPELHGWTSTVPPPGLTTGSWWRTSALELAGRI